MKTKGYVISNKVLNTNPKRKIIGRLVKQNVARNHIPTSIAQLETWRARDASKLDTATVINKLRKTLVTLFLMMCWSSEESKHERLKSKYMT